MRLQKRVLVSGLAALFGVMVMLMVGCGDDEGTTGPTTITGQLDDPEFVAVRSQIDDFVDSTVSFLKNGLNTIDGISDGGVIIPPQYIVDPEDQNVNLFDTSYVNGWHVIRIIYTHRNQSEQAVWQTELTDSIQYKKNGVAQETWVDRDQLLYRHHWSFDVFDTTVSYFAFDDHADFTFDDLNTTAATVTGSRELNVHAKQVTVDSTLWWDFTFTSDVNNITLKRSAFTGWSQCPTGGSVSAEIVMVYQKDDDDPITTTWNVTVTFNNGAVAASVTRGNTVWSYSGDVCDVPQ